jgi:hypothetical protein
MRYDQDDENDPCALVMDLKEDEKEDRGAVDQLAALRERSRQREEVREEGNQLGDQDDELEDQDALLSYHHD